MRPSQGILSLSAWVVALIGGAASAQGPTEYVVRWIDRPWEYRYLLYTRTAFSWAGERERFAKLTVKKPQQAGEFGEPIEVHFNPTLTLALLHEDPEGHLQVLRLDIDKNRTILQPNLKGDHLRPRLNWLMGIVLTPSDDSPSYVVHFGYFFMGAYGASDTRYSPAICSHLLGDSAPEDGIGRYKPKDDPTGLYGFFGCREWAAQLYDDRRPYIDVTSYEMVDDYDRPAVKGKLPKKPETFIRPFVGFSRFDSPIKPVIGNHKGTWYCITDCPNGDSPGAIADMKAWAKRGGWPMPAKPRNVRELMDTPVKRGEVQE